MIIDKQQNKFSLENYSVYEKIIGISFICSKQFCYDLMSPVTITNDWDKAANKKYEFTKQ
jgi:hypothetical protein